MVDYPTYIMGATDLIGGGDGAVDNIPTADLADLDGIIAVTTSGTFIFSIDENSGAAESSPYVIKPDDEGGGNKRLLLQRLSESAFETGTVAFYGQNTAPTGWTKKTDWTDNSMLIYTTGNIADAGSDDPKNWTTALASASHSISIAELAYHRHDVALTDQDIVGAGSMTFLSSFGTKYTGYTGSNDAHSHTLTQDTFTPKYQTVIAATKD